MRRSPLYSGVMFARLIASLSGARLGRAPMALLALVAGLALAIGGGPAETIAHAAEVQAAQSADPTDTAVSAAPAEDPGMPPGKAPITVHPLCAGHCAAHLANLPVPAEGEVAGRVEAADWSLGPPAPAYRASPEGLERPPRV